MGTHNSDTDQKHECHRPAQLGMVMLNLLRRAGRRDGRAAALAARTMAAPPSLHRAQTVLALLRVRRDDLVHTHMPHLRALKRAPPAVLRRAGVPPLALTAMPFARARAAPARDVLPIDKPDGRVFLEAAHLVRRQRDLRRRTIRREKVGRAVACPRTIRGVEGGLRELFYRTMLLLLEICAAALRGIEGPFRPWGRLPA